MYPLTCIRISKNKKISVELKNSKVYEGTLIGCDFNMNIHLKNVILKSLEDRFYLAETYIRGSTIKHIKLNENILQMQSKFEKNKKRQG